MINGGGAARPELEAAAADLPNVRFIDMQPAERLPDVLAAADVHVVPLRAGLAWSSVPSKLYSILAAGRPLVASVDEGTEVARTVERAGAGISVPPDDPAAFTAAVGRLLDDPQAAAQMGAAGRRFVEGWASPAAVAAAYESLFVELSARRGHRRSSRDQAVTATRPGSGRHAGARRPAASLSGLWARQVLPRKSLAPHGREVAPPRGRSVRCGYPLAIAAIVIVGVLVVLVARTENETASAAHPHDRASTGTRRTASTSVTPSCPPSPIR